MEIVNKKCSKCGEVKDISQFQKNYTKRKNGSPVGDGYRTDYKICSNLRRKKCYDQNPLTRMFMNSKARARNSGLEFNLEYSDLIIPDKCPILNIPFVLGAKDNYPYSPSIDRIDSTKGYIKGNVKIITLLANRMKTNATKEQCLEFAKNIENYYDDIV